MADLEIDETTSDSITVYVSGLDPSFRGKRFYYFYIAENYFSLNSANFPSYSDYFYGVFTETYSSSVDESSSFTYDGLDSNTKYYVQVRIAYIPEKSDSMSDWGDAFVPSAGATSARTSSATTTTYSCTIYFDDAGIGSISATYYSGVGNTTFSGSYGDENLKKTGLASGRSIVFTATPIDGDSFSRWVYRVGSTTSTQKYNTDNPLTLEVTGNIYIRAESENGGGVSANWSVSSASIMLASELEMDTLATNAGPEFAAYTARRFHVTFASAGTATFYTVSDYATVGALTTDSGTDFNAASNGKYILPSGCLASNVGTTKDFSFTYNVQAGTDYYLWVCVYGGSAVSSGTIKVRVKLAARTAETVDGWSNVTPYVYSDGKWVPVTGVYLYSNGAWNATTPYIKT